ncbi:hypothetical protein ACT3SZ_05765 [Corynebacterium sp. AOP40-9SA-29]|uniref:hypothetical protein n=1 Tax=Corynebacterium sp. AOP40-9SA-29 TaxID=3457677 RepID=UPI004033E3EF
MNSVLSPSTVLLLDRLEIEVGDELGSRRLLLKYAQQDEDFYNVSELINSLRVDGSSGVVHCLDYEDTYNILARRLDEGVQSEKQRRFDEIAFSVIDAVDQMRGERIPKDRLLVCAEALIGVDFDKTRLEKALEEILE